MGCDIRAHAEVKFNDRWQHYSLLDLPRNYDLFTFLAGVRDTGCCKPLSKPRGIPLDATTSTMIDFQRESTDAHSASWIGPEEIKKLEEWYRENHAQFKFILPWGWLYGNNWSDFLDYPNTARTVGDMKLQDIRFIFWFTG